MFGRKVTGSDGAIRIVELGAVIGQVSKWSLTRETAGDDETSTGYFTFRAEMRYINAALFESSEYESTVFITTGKDRQTRQVQQCRLEQAEGRKVELKGRSLLMEGVKVCPA